MTESHYDEPCMRVVTVLRPSTFKALRELTAGRPGLTVGGALSVVADQALADRRGLGMPAARGPREVAPASHEPRDALDRDIARLNGEGLNDRAIVRELGVVQSTVSARRRRMLLESPGKFGGNRRAES